MEKETLFFVLFREIRSKGRKPSWKRGRGSSRQAPLHKIFSGEGKSGRRAGDSLREEEGKDATCFLSFLVVILISLSAWEEDGRAETKIPES